MENEHTTAALNNMAKLHAKKKKLCESSQTQKDIYFCLYEVQKQVKINLCGNGGQNSDYQLGVFTGREHKRNLGCWKHSMSLVRVGLSAQ